MSQLLQSQPPAPLPEDDDPFRYGWRYVRRTLPDGSEQVDIVPLSQEDLLYPEEDDFVVQKPPHSRDFAYCLSALTTYYEGQAGMVVLGDCRVDWGVAGVRPLGPDILILADVREWLQQGTFRIAVEGGRPLVVVEIASPSTRVHDLGAKVGLYYRVGVQRYVIIDRGPQGEDPARLLGYMRSPTGWVPLAPDAQGRLDLAPVTLRLGLSDDHPWFYDVATGERLSDLSAALHERDAARQGRTAAEAKASEEAQARMEAEAKAQAAETKAHAETQARVEAEARAHAAETKAHDEAQARAALELRLRHLEDQLRRQDSP